MWLLVSPAAASSSSRRSRPARGSGSTRSRHSGPNSPSSAPASASMRCRVPAIAAQSASGRDSPKCSRAACSSWFRMFRRSSRSPAIRRRRGSASGRSQTCGTPAPAERWSRRSAAAERAAASAGSGIPAQANPGAASARARRTASPRASIAFRIVSASPSDAFPALSPSQTLVSCSRNGCGRRLRREAASSIRSRRAASSAARSPTSKSTSGRSRTRAKSPCTRNTDLPSGSRTRCSARTNRLRSSRRLSSSS